MDNTRDIIRHQTLTGKFRGRQLAPQELTIRARILNWEYGCSVDCKHYTRGFFGDYGCEFAHCPFKETDFEGWRKLRAESYLMGTDKSSLRKAYKAIMALMPWFPDEEGKRPNE